ncbi:hypothetical protein [Bacillus sp. LK2]|uniref:hypothetical protein n=1 Tax=Bacillus sp. LK2 TaxID=1628206 RepID=UPI000653552E|nr:hypothetical protein [Bacillus sp. LK2]KMN42980.1 hypothetical protein VK90_21590 [Bacillus sp. LK2]
MSEPKVKAIVQELYYDFPDWLDKVECKEYISLTKNNSPQDVDLFLVGLFGYNHIDISNGPITAFKDLLNAESIVMAGGILFIEDEEKMIFPSCCSGLEGWRDIFNGVIEGSSPWMGHNPYPTLQFEDDIVHVWSDDYIGIWEQNLSNDDMYCIEYGRDNLITKLKNIETDLKEFSHVPLYNRIKQFDEKLAEQVVAKFLIWFDVKE